MFQLYLKVMDGVANEILIHRLCPQVCETCWNRPKSRSLLDMVATIKARWRAGSPDSSQTMFGGFGRAVCNGDYTGYGNKRSKTNINRSIETLCPLKDYQL